MFLMFPSITITVPYKIDCYVQTSGISLQSSDINIWKVIFGIVRIIFPKVSQYNHVCGIMIDRMTLFTFIYFIS